MLGPSNGVQLEPWHKPMRAVPSCMHPGHYKPNLGEPGMISMASKVHFQTEECSKLKAQKSKLFTTEATSPCPDPKSSKYLPTQWPKRLAIGPSKKEMESERLPNKTQLQNPMRNVTLSLDSRPKAPPLLPNPMMGPTYIQKRNKRQQKRGPTNESSP